MAMVRLQLADLEKRAGWIHVIDRKGSIGILSLRLWEGPRGWRLKEWGEDTPRLLSPSVEGEGYNSLGNAVPVVRVHAMHEGCEEGGAGGSGRILVNYDRESSGLMTGLSLRAQGQRCCQHRGSEWEPVVREPTAGN